MTYRLRPFQLLLTTGFALLLSACSAASTPAATTAPVGGSTASATTASATAPQATSTAVAAATASAALPTTATASGKACTIVTTDAVAQAVGFAINATSGIGSACFFQNADVSKFLVINLYESQAEMATSLQMETGSSHIANLGDDAFWVPVAGILFVRKGDHAIEISDSDSAFTAASATAKQAAFVTLATLALPNL